MDLSVVDLQTLSPALEKCHEKLFLFNFLNVLDHFTYADESDWPPPQFLSNWPVLWLRLLARLFCSNKHNFRHLCDLRWKPGDGVQYHKWGHSASMGLHNCPGL